MLSTDADSVRLPAPPSVHDLVAGMPHGMGTLADKLGIVIVKGDARELVGTMPVVGNGQPYGLLHGGASVALAETLGSVAAGVHAYPDKVAVGVDINATHHRSATSGVVTGRATAVHLGRTSTCHHVEITDENGKRVCTARITCALVPSDRVLGMPDGT